MIGIALRLMISIALRLMIGITLRLMIGIALRPDDSEGIIYLNSRGLAQGEADRPNRRGNPR